MVRNNLELACDSLFINNFKNASKAIGLLSVHDADAIIITNELLPHPLWLNHLNLPFILRINTEHHYRMNILALLGGTHCQNHLGSFSKSV
jgi:hypothetical protein